MLSTQDMATLLLHAPRTTLTVETEEEWQKRAYFPDTPDLDSEEEHVEETDELAEFTPDDIDEMFGDVRPLCVPGRWLDAALEAELAEMAEALESGEMVILTDSPEETAAVRAALADKAA